MTDSTPHSSHTPASGPAVGQDEWVARHAARRLMPDGPLRTVEDQGLFLKAVSALVGPSEGVAVGFPGRRTDHEAELGIGQVQPTRRAAETDQLARGNRLDQYVAGAGIDGLDHPLLERIVIAHRSHLHIVADNHAVEADIARS